MNCVLYWQTIVLSKYDRTTGIVTEADSVYRYDTDINSSRSQYITLTYTYQGKIYTDAENHNLPRWDEPFEVGDKLDMYIKPDHPHNFYIATKTGRTTTGLIKFAIADAAVTVAVAAFLIGIKTGWTKLAS